MVIAVIRRLLANWWFRIGATLVLLAVIVWRSEPQRIAASFGQLGLINILLALSLTVPFLFFKALRWQIMLRNAGTEVSFADAAISLVGGMGLALITPARLGEIARVAYLRDTRKVRLAALVLLDKFFDVLVLVLLAIGGAWQHLGPAFGVVFALGGVAGLVFTYRPQLFTPITKGIEARIPLAGKTGEVMSALESLSPVATTVYILLTLASFVIVIGQFGIILHGPEPGLGLNVAASVFPLVILTNVIPLTVAGLGIREAAAAVLLSQYHVPIAVASVAAFMMFFVNTAIPGFVGALLPVFRRGVAAGNRESIRSEAETAAPTRT
jgi:hypothetical protein